MNAPVTAPLLAVLLLTAPAAMPAALLTYEGALPEGGRALDMTLQGWSFTTTSPIIITHLGLYDDFQDGFDIAHPIGLFRQSDGVELTSGTLGAGTVDPLLINEFRYVDVADVALASGEQYVLSYYTNDPGSTNRDYQLGVWDSLTISPAITFGDTLFQSNAPGLGIPAISRSGGPYFVGPNALFTVVPIPTGAWLFTGALMLLGAVRRRSA
jgi:hypothetical protein